MVALSVFVAARTLHTDARLSADDRRLNHGLTSAHLHHALVFLPQLAGPELLIPFGTAINHYGYTGNVVYALDQGPAGDAIIAADFPDRRPYLLVVTRDLSIRPTRPHAHHPPPAIDRRIERPQHLLNAQLKRLFAVERPDGPGTPGLTADVFSAPGFEPIDGAMSRARWR